LNSLESLGYSDFFSTHFASLGGDDLVPARIASEGRGIYSLLGCAAALGELRGRLRHELEPAQWPVAGDWVAVADGEDKAIIHHVLERRTAMFRRAAGSEGSVQVVAANVDLFFVVTSANRDFNLRRLERYMTAVWDSGATPVIVLNKIDLGRNVEEMAEKIETVGMGVPVVRVSALTGAGLEDLSAHIESGKTVGLVGSSGVGKSSLVNRLIGREVQAVQGLRKDGKGRHATSRRELIELPGGGMLLDTPGMRELGLVEDSGGMDSAFADVAELAVNCRFRNCAHDGEPGCAVESALEAGTLDDERLAAYRKLRREIEAAERRSDPVHAERPKRRWKSIAKAIRERTKVDPKFRE
jgi:ribosome biogenesis GTPase